MRHRKRKKRFGCRTIGHRKAMMRSLVSALFLHQKIKTIAPRAKEVKRMADRLITLGKRSTIHARRQAFETLQDRALVKKLFDQIAPVFEKRAGGYTRLVRLLPRAGDGAEMAILELTEIIATPERGKTKPAKKSSRPSKELKPEVKPKEKKEPKEEKKEPLKEEKEPLKEEKEPLKEKKEPKEKEIVPEKKEKKSAGFLEGLRKRFRSNR